MRKQFRLVVVSDIHYASAAEHARHGHETRVIVNPAVRLLVKLYRNYIWMRDPFGHNDLLDRFVAEAGRPDLVVANGDYSCDTGFIGVCDEAAAASATTCLGTLRSRFAGTFAAILGDHELGKMSLVGGRGGMRLASWRRACGELGLEPFWRIELENYVLMGVTSSLIALPVYEPEALPEEITEWRRLRAVHLAAIVSAFGELRPNQKVLLFCHDPTALPFLWGQPEVRAHSAQIERTIIGHLHTQLILWKSRLLAGMPTIRFLGNSIRRMSTALHEARHWRPFRVMLCPALAGCQLLNDGGFCSLELDLSAETPPGFRFHPLPRPG